MLFLRLVLYFSILFGIIFCSDIDFAEFEDPDDTTNVKKYNDLNLKSNKEDKTKQTEESEFNSQSPSNPIDHSGHENITEEEVSKNQSKNPKDLNENFESEEDETLNFNDNEEFEGYKSDNNQPKILKRDIKIAKVPHHLKSSWENYVLEFLMLSGLVVYILGFLVGKTKNQNLAEYWINIHKDILLSNFSIIGDDGGNNVNTCQLHKEAEHLYNLWCSGRVYVEGLYVELKLLKRQDLISILSYWIKPMFDQIIYTIRLDPTEMDPFVFALVQKKRVNSLLKDFNDISFFCPDKKVPPRPIVPDNFVLLSEIGEATAAILDNQMARFLEDFSDIIEYIHISDQFSSAKSNDPDSPNIVPETKVESIITICFKVGNKGNLNNADLEKTKPILHFIFYLIERARKVKLTKEAKLKSEKNRRKAVETFQKQLHSQRQEAAQQRREEKRRIEKEKILAEDDPEKARRLEEKDNKKEAKRKQPKTKLLKVKGM